jgi:hypothetical protein
MFLHSVQNKEFVPVIARGNEPCHQPVISFSWEGQQEVMYQQDKAIVVHLLPNPF